MTQFSRRARWLDALFPQSVAPANPDPATRSDDVSLVQSYDGGGWGLAEATFPAEIDLDVIPGPVVISQAEISIRGVLTEIGAITITPLIEMDRRHYARVFAMTRQGVAGGAPNPDNTFLTINPPTPNAGNQAVVVSEPENPSAGFANTVPIGFQGPTGAATNQHYWNVVSGPLVIPSGMVLAYHSLGGSATTQWRLITLMQVFPTGAVARI